MIRFEIQPRFAEDQEHLEKSDLVQVVERLELMLYEITQVPVVIEIKKGE